MPTEPPFDPKEFLRERRQALKDSIADFGRSNLPERERWVVRELLKNLGVSFAVGSFQRTGVVRMVAAAEVGARIGEALIADGDGAA
jgi:hypothetical protein